jgi:hypothetical protein
MTRTSTHPVPESRQLAAINPDHRLSIVLRDHLNIDGSPPVGYPRSVLAPQGR